MSLRDEIFRRRRPTPEPVRVTDEKLLAFEHDNAPCGHTPAKEERIRRDLRITPARYYQLLGRLIWTEDALRIDPMLTNRLRAAGMKAATERARRLGY